MKKNIVFTATILLFPAMGCGAECKTSRSGTTCSAFCTEGRLSLACGENACSSTCTDGDGNYVAALIKDIKTASEYPIDSETCLRQLAWSRKNEVIHCDSITLIGDAEAFKGIGERERRESIQRFRSQSAEDIRKAIDPRSTWTNCRRTDLGIVSCNEGKYRYGEFH